MENNSQDRARTADLRNRLRGSTGSLPDDLQMIPDLRCAFEILEAAVREVPFQPGIPDTSTLFHEWCTAMDSIFFPGPPRQHVPMNFPERALPHVAACLYHKINDLSFLRHAGAQLHSAGGLAFFLMARDALRDFFPIDCVWLRGTALAVLDIAWHGIGAWRQGMHYLAADPEA